MNVAPSPPCVVFPFHGHFTSGCCSLVLLTATTKVVPPCLGGWPMAHLRVVLHHAPFNHALETPCLSSLKRSPRAASLSCCGAPRAVLGTCHTGWGWTKGRCEGARREPEARGGATCMESPRHWQVQYSHPTRSRSVLLQCILGRMASHAPRESQESERLTIVHHMSRCL